MKNLIKAIVCAAVLNIATAARADEVAVFNVSNKLAGKCDSLNRGDTFHLTVNFLGEWEGYFETEMASGVIVRGYGRTVVKFKGGRLTATLFADYLEFGDGCVFYNLRFTGDIYAIN